MGGVVNHLQGMPLGNRVDRLDSAGNSVAVNRHDGAGVRRDRGLNPAGIERERIGIDIDKHRRETVPTQGVCRGDERIGGGDHLPGDPQSLQADHQTERAVGDQREVRDPEMVAESLLELLVEGAAVGEDAAFPDLLQIGRQLFQRWQEGLRDIDRLVGRHERGWVK